MQGARWRKGTRALRRNGTGAREGAHAQGCAGALEGAQARSRARGREGVRACARRGAPAHRNPCFSRRIPK